MNQDHIWDHFQNQALAHFDDAGPRLEFLARRLRPGERVLNIGVGAGTLEELALRKGVEIWSLDPSERTIERLRERLGVGERAQAGYSQAPPFPAGQFDAVIMSEVLEHLDPAICEATLEQVHRILRQGGRFIGTVPARERLELAEVVCPSCDHHFHRWGHQASFDVPALRELLGDKFSVDRIEEQFFNEWDSAGWSRRAAGLLKKFLSWRGLGPYGVARNIYFCVSKAGASDSRPSGR
jgi:SAM-dependent methyltransferase